MAALRGLPRDPAQFGGRSRRWESNPHSPEEPEFEAAHGRAAACRPLSQRPSRAGFRRFSALLRVGSFWPETPGRVARGLRAPAVSALVAGRSLEPRDGGRPGNCAR